MKIIHIVTIIATLSSFTVANTVRGTTRSDVSEIFDKLGPEAAKQYIEEMKIEGDYADDDDEEDDDSDDDGRKLQAERRLPSWCKSSIIKKCKSCCDKKYKNSNCNRKKKWGSKVQCWEWKWDCKEDCQWDCTTKCF